MAVVKKSDTDKKVVSPVKIEVTKADEQRIEEELFGSLAGGGSSSSPATHSTHGVTSRKVVSSRDEETDSAKQKSKLSSLKKPLVIKKKAVAIQETVVDEKNIVSEEETKHGLIDTVPESGHSLTAPKKEKHPVKTLAEQQILREKEREKEKEKEKEREKERQIREALDVEAKSVARLEKALTSLKAPVEPVYTDDDYEEVEEVVSEVIEEIEYEDEIIPDIVPAKGKEDPKAAFGGAGQRRRKKKKKKTPEDAIAAKDAVKRTLAKINVEDTASRKRYRKAGDDGEVEIEDDKTIFVSDFMSVAEVANQMMIKPAEPSWR